MTKKHRSASPVDGSRRRQARLSKELAERLIAEGASHYAAGRIDEAARAYESVEHHNPEDVRAVYALAVIDIRQNRLTSARKRLRFAIRRDGSVFAAHQNLGSVCQTLGRWHEAAQAFAAALELKSDSVETSFSLATALTITGEIDRAITCYRTVAAIPVARHRALTRLAILKPEAIGAEELRDLRRDAWNPAIERSVRTGLLFALGEVLDRHGSFDEAFEAYAAGNALKRGSLGGLDGCEASPAEAMHAHDTATRFVRNVFTAGFIAEHQGGDHSAAAPIFVVGMPRSGSSLIEQVLSGHSRVCGMGESRTMSETVDGRFPYGPIETTPATHFRNLADRYLGAMHERGWKPGLRLVDKTLENYLHVGMIRLMFPRATILHSVRDPVDTCVACYRQLFAGGNETLYDLADIGEEYVRYRKLMDHWATVLPGQVVDVSYEALVADPSAKIQWLVTRVCGLKWDPACLKFHKAKGVVRTSSAAQVREPIFLSSVRRWRRYGDKLGPLFEALGEYAPSSR